MGEQATPTLLAGSILVATGEVLRLLVFVGGVIVGGIGALLSRARGGIGGFLRSLFPIWPLGWVWVIWSTRNSAGRRSDDVVLEPYHPAGVPTPPIAVLDPIDGPDASSSGGSRF